MFLIMQALCSLTGFGSELSRRKDYKKNGYKSKMMHCSYWPFQSEYRFWKVNRWLDFRTATCRNCGVRSFNDIEGFFIDSNFKDKDRKKMTYLVYSFLKKWKFICSKATRSGQNINGNILLVCQKIAKELTSKFIAAEPYGIVLPRIFVNMDETFTSLLLKRMTVYSFVCIWYASRGVWLVLTGKITPRGAPPATNHSARRWRQPVPCSLIDHTHITMMIAPARRTPHAQSVTGGGGL